MTTRLRSVASGQTVIGVEDVRRALLALPDRLARNSVRRALYEAGNVIRDDARTRAPVRQGVSARFAGTLKRSIVTDTRVDRKRDTVRVRVFVKKTGGKGKGPVPRAYAHLVEFGTRPHTLGRGSRLYRETRRTQRQNQFGAMHPGTKAKPFFRPAFEGKKVEAVRVFSESLRRQLRSDVEAASRGGGGAS